MHGRIVDRSLELGGCMSLEPPEYEVLAQLLTKADRDLNRLGEYCHELENVVADRAFLYVYAAILAANRGQVSESVRLLQQCPRDLFGSLLRPYLEGRKTFAPPASVFADSHPYDVFTRSEFYREHLQAAVNAAGDFGRQFPAPSGLKHFTVLDIGSGNGLLITEVINRLASETHAQACHLIIVEQSEAMLAAAEAYCTANVKIPLTTTHIESRIEDIAHGCLNDFLDVHPIWFVNASLSLHHMPSQDKINVLRQLKDVSGHCLLTELNGNHDRTEKDSPEFVYSVVKIFAHIIQAVRESSLPEADKQVCISDYLMSEAIRMLSSSHDNRIDFHATVADWRDYAEKSGWEVAKISPSVCVGDRPLLFTMHLRSRS